MLISNIIKL